jgi:hypothetical protein
VPEVLADSVGIAGMGVAVYAFQHCGNRQDGKSALDGESGLKLAAPEAAYQRAQHWVRRFSKQAEPLSSALAALTAVIAAPSFVSKALGMLEKIGWMAAHRFLFSDLRMHLLGWGQSLAPHGLRITINAVSSTPGALPQTTCIDSENPSD